MGLGIRKKIMRQIANTMELPPEVVMDYPRITVVGSTEALIENHKGLVQYTADCIKAKSLQGVIVVTGHNLHIQFFSSNEIKITGHLHHVEWV